MSSTTDTEHRFAYLLSPEFEIVNTAGKPLTGGWIEVYLHGTRNKYYCFSDFNGTLHPFQIPLDSLGSNIILASPLHAYDVYIYNKFGSLVMSRYNIVPATNSSDAIADIIVIDSPSETINVVVDGGTNWHLEVNTDLIATASGLDAVSGELSNKKDKQTELTFNGAATKTIKKITQNANGEITVEYEDIDLPPEVPNVEITSPNGTLNVTSTTNPSTNTKTFKLDVNSDAINSYYIGKSGSSATMVKGQTVTLPLPLSNMSLKGEDIDPSNGLTAALNDGLYLISYNIHVVQDANSVENSYNDLTMYFGCQNEIVYDYRDASYPDTLNYPYGRTFTGSFVREVAEGADNQAYITLDAPYNGIAYIKEISIVKLNGIFGQSSPRYAPGYGIVIDDDNTISVATGDVITHNYFDIVIDAVSGDIVNLSESVTNLIGATGDYATKDYVDAAVSGLENYSAGQYISIEDHVISATGLQPAGNYATVEQLNEVAGDVNNLTEIVNNITNVTGDFATVEYVDNRIATAAGDVYEAGQYISIEDGVIAATGLQPAGNYATEQYVDDAVAAVSGQPINQVQSDWTQADNTKVDYIKHKPRQVNLVAGDNITIEQDGNDVIISGDTYAAGQYISIQNNTIAATGLQPAGNYLTPADLNGYATEQYVDDAVAAVTGQPISQVNSDWLATSGVAEILNKPDVFQLIAGDNIDITASGNDLVISASSDVTKAYVDEQIDAATGMIPTLPAEEEVEFEELDLTNYALASAIPDISNLATKAEVQAATGMIPDVSNFATNDDVQYVQEQVDQLVAATGDYLQASDLDGYATEQDLSDAIDTVTGMIPDISDLATKSELSAVEAEIPDISNLATKTELNAVDAKVDAVSAEIPTLPSEEEVEFEELNLSDYALASAIPDISNLATKTELQEVEAEIPDISNLATKAEVQAATGMIPDISDLATKSELSAVEAEIPDISNLATKTEVQTVDAKVDAVSAAIPSEEEVEFEELDLSNYALASAIPDVSDLATKADVQAATGMIPDVSDLATKSEVQAVDAKVDTVSASIPESEEVEFEELDISDFALASAIPDISDLATKSELDDYISYSASSVYLPNANFGIAHDGKAYTFVQRSTSTDYSTTYDGSTELNYTTFDPALVLNTGDTISFTHSHYSYTPYIEVNGTWVVGNEGEPDRYGISTHTWTVPNDSYTINSVAVGSIGEMHSERISTITVTVDELRREEYALKSEIPQVELNSNDQVTAIDGHTIVGGGSSYTAGAGIDITNDEISIDNTVALKSEIPTLPEDEEVEFKELDLSDYALASAIPDVSTLATKSELAAVEAEIPDVSNLASKTYVDESIAAIPALSGTDGVIVEDNVVSLDNPVNLVAGDNVNITVSGDDVVISAQGGGASYTAGNGIDITNDAISVDSTVALKTDIPDITNLATKSEVQAVEAEIPVVTGFATKSELATVEAEIPTLPTEEDVDFEELDLADYALASAIPDVSTFATKAEVTTAINTVTGMIPDLSDLNTAGVTDIQVVQTLPASPVATVLYLIPEA